MTINKYVFRFQFLPHSPHKKKVKRKHWKRGLSMNVNYKGKIEHYHISNLGEYCRTRAEKKA